MLTTPLRFDVIINTVVKPFDCQCQVSCTRATLVDEQKISIVMNQTSIPVVQYRHERKTFLSTYTVKRNWLRVYRYLVIDIFLFIIHKCITIPTKVVLVFNWIINNFTS